eukprot:TRINITY_DN5680_c0_g1_i2.p1 TRINITY_DN5680_c0_g1~~TRINITY_DN5680_c0_g1_i2.p1  ORF type:complete len:382 (-),score=44.71 TRINITY_DN5680_c0_g1_i2:109-1254(-)
MSESDDEIFIPTERESSQLQYRTFKTHSSMLRSFGMVESHSLGPTRLPEEYKTPTESLYDSYPLVTSRPELGNIQYSQSGEDDKDVEMFREFIKHSITEYVDNMFIDMSTIKLAETLGEGAVSKVYRGIWVRRNVAVKMFFKKSLVIEDVKELSRELAVILRLRPHPNVVSMIGVSCYENTPCLVTEHCPGGSLSDLLHKRPEVHLSMKAKISFALDIACGMFYLHSSRPLIVHRDLKSSNILLEDQFDEASQRARLKISDFGISKVLIKNSDIFHGEMRKNYWMAPEFIENQPMGVKADVYSFGILLWEIVCRKVPFERFQSPFAMMHHIIEGGRPENDALPSDCPEAVCELLDLCLQRQPERRPTFESIIETLQTLNEY